VKTILVILPIMVLLLVGCAQSPAPGVTEVEPPNKMPPRTTELTPRPSLEDKETDMAAVAKAKEDIERYRKSDVTLTILDSRGGLCSGVTVDYRQTGHSFLFGFFNTWYDAVAASLMKEASLNYMTVSLFWQLVEPQPGTYNFDEIDKSFGILHLPQLGFLGMGHGLLWLTTEWQALPEHILTLPFEEFKEAVYHHIYRVVDYYKEEIRVWNVINEPMMRQANSLGLSEQQIIEVIREGSRAIRDADPEALVMINVWPPGGENVGGRDKGMYPYDFLKDAIDDGVDFDIIGLECYYNGYTSERFFGGVPFPRRSLSSIDELIDKYSTLGKTIFITELSVPSEKAGEGYWAQPWSQELQARYLVAAYTIFFSKPQVGAITWWDACDRADTFIHHGGLIDEQNQPKKAYYALKELIQSWTTTGIGITDEKGQISFRGFGGTYEVIITDSKTGLSKQQKITIDEQKDNLITIVFD